MTSEVVFRVPASLTRRGSGGGSGDGTTGTAGCAVSVAAAASGGGDDCSSDNRSEIKQSAPSHVDIPLTVDPKESLGSVFNRLLRPHLPYCCLPRDVLRPQGSGDGEDGSRAVESGLGSQLQRVRFMDSEQRVCLSPDLSVEAATLDRGSTIHVLPEETVRGGVDGGSMSDSPETVTPAASFPPATPASSTAADPASSLTTAPAAAVHVSAATSSPAPNPPAGSAAAATSPSADSSNRSQLAPRSGGGSMGLTDMIHYMELRNGWDPTGCERCLKRGASSPGQFALAMESYEDFRLWLQFDKFASLPLTPGGAEGVDPRAMLDNSSGLPLPGNPCAQHLMKGLIVPFMCAQGMLLEWLAEPRVGVLMDLGKVRSRLPAIFAHSASAASSPASSAAAGSSAAGLSAAGSSAAGSSAAGSSAAGSSAVAPWSCCWRCSSCWAAYRRALGFATFFVLVARWPRFVTLWRASLEIDQGVFPTLVGELGGVRLVEKDTFASMLVQILGVKEEGELEEGFGFYVQHLLSGGIEKAHVVGKAAVLDPTGERVKRNTGKDVCSDKELCGGATVCERDGKEGGDEKWREHLRGPVWERYVDGMGGILKGGGGEGRAFRCSHCCGDSGRSSGRSNSGSVGVGSGPLGMHVSGIGATDFALTVAAVLSQPEHWKAVKAFAMDGSNASKTRLEDAAIEAAAEKLRGLTSGLGQPSEAGGGGAEGGTLAAGTVLLPAAATPATSTATSATPGTQFCTASGGGNSGSGSGSAIYRDRAPATPERVPVNTHSVVAALTYRASCILTWARIYGSDSMMRKQCFKGDSQGKVLPMCHPLRDIPSLLLRLGGFPKTLEAGSFPLEWEEWPQGDETAVKFPINPRVRCFGLGFMENRRAVEKGPNPSKQPFPGGGTSTASSARGAPRAVGKGRTCVTAEGERLEVLAVALTPPRKQFPIVRCREDIDFLVGFVGAFVKSPACTKCRGCITTYANSISSAAVIANFAYRPVSVLFNCFISLFPRHSPEYALLQSRLALADSIDPPVSLPELQRRAEVMPILFLLVVSMYWAHDVLEINELLGATRRKAGERMPLRERKAAKERRKKAGAGEEGGEDEEDDGEVWEEVRMWCVAATIAWQPFTDMIDRCSGLHKQITDGGSFDPTWLLKKAAVPRFCEELTDHDEPLDSTSEGDCGGEGDGSSSSSSSGGGGGSSNRKVKKVPGYLKPWPGGINVLACLREMLLGQPCYLPPSPAASSIPAATTSISAGAGAGAPLSSCGPTSSPGPASAAQDASFRKGFRAAPCSRCVCGAEGGGSGGVKLKGCGACGKVAYCSKECQKSDWPSHKLTCSWSSSRGGAVDGSKG